MTLFFFLYVSDIYRYIFYHCTETIIIVVIFGLFLLLDFKQKGEEKCRI